MIHAKIKINSRVGNLSGRLINYCFRQENTTDECSSGAIFKHFANTFLPYLCLMLVTKMQYHAFFTRDFNGDETSQTPREPQIRS